MKTCALAGRPVASRSAGQISPSGRAGLKVFTLLALMMVAAPSVAQAQDFLWAKQSEVTFKQLSVDRSHNVYGVGFFLGTVDFDPGPGTFELTASGGFDAFALKLDRDGGFLWAGRLGGNSYTWPGGAALDDDGDLYIGGYFESTTDFDPGPGTFELEGNHDAFVCKLDSSGNLVWVMAFQAEPLLAGSSEGESVAVEGDHVYTFGYFEGTVDFDPGPGTFELTASLPWDLYLSKHDTSGHIIWAVQLVEGGDTEWSGDVVVDPNGHVYTVGRFEETADFDPGPGTFNLTSFGDFDVFISRLDSAGNFVWAGQLGGPERVAPTRAVVDRSGYLYTVGRFSGTADFDPGPGAFNLTSLGEYDGFVSKLDSAGDFVGAMQLPVSYGGVALDRGDNVYTVGRFNDTVDFDPGPGTFFLTSYGGSDAFVSKHDSAGNLVWAKQLGGTLNDGHSVVALDSSDNVYTRGWFYGTADFDPGPGTFFLTPTGESDSFLWKFGYVDIRLESQDPTSIHFSPDSPSLSFDVATGLLSELQADDDFTRATCLGTFSGNPASDDSTPAVGDGFYYLARGLSCCTTQGYGDSTLTPDPRDDLDLISPCP